MARLVPLHWSPALRMFAISDYVPIMSGIFDLAVVLGVLLFWSPEFGGCWWWVRSGLFALFAYMGIGSLKRGLFALRHRDSSDGRPKTRYSVSIKMSDQEFTLLAAWKDMRPAHLLARCAVIRGLECRIKLPASACAAFLGQHSGTSAPAGTSNSTNVRLTRQKS